MLEPWLRSLQLALTTIAYRDPQGATYTRATCDYPLLMLSNPRFNFKPRLSLMVVGQMVYYCVGPVELFHKQQANHLVRECHL